MPSDANSPRLSGSLSYTDRISHSPKQINAHKMHLSDMLGVYGMNFLIFDEHLRFDRKMSTFNHAF